MKDPAKAANYAYNEAKKEAARLNPDQAPPRKPAIADVGVPSDFEERMKDPAKAANHAYNEAKKEAARLNPD